jgi:hypothetical protein
MTIIPVLRAWRHGWLQSAFRGPMTRSPPSLDDCGQDTGLDFRATLRFLLSN